MLKKNLWMTAGLCLLVLAVIVQIMPNSGQSGQPVASDSYREGTERETEPDLTIKEKPLMMQDVIPEGADYDSYMVLGSDYKRQQISSITFLNTLKDKKENAWDVSAGQDETVLAWTEPAGDEKYDLYIAGEGGVQAPVSSAGLFAHYEAAEINFNGCFDTSKTEDMKMMFFCSGKLEQLDLKEFDTSSVTDMSLMFANCTGLKQLDVSSFNTSRVTTMELMFSNCGQLEQLNVTGFDTGRVTTMSCMFAQCTNLRELDVTGFRADSLKDESGMFAGCDSLPKPWGTAAAEDLPVMMSDIVPEDTEYSDLKVLGSEYKRTDILTITFLDNLDNQPKDAWDVSAEQDGSVMAWVKPKEDGKYALYIGGEGGVRAPEVCLELFYFYNHVTEIQFNGCFDTSQTTNMENMFRCCVDLQKLDLSGFDTGKVENMHAMFCLCETVKKLDLNYFDTSQVTDMGFMFSGCEELRTLKLKNFDTHRVTGMAYMFRGCKKLGKLNLKHFDMSNVTSNGHMFEECPAEVIGLD